MYQNLEGACTNLEFKYIQGNLSNRDYYIRQFFELQVQALLLDNLQVR